MQTSADGQYLNLVRAFLLVGPEKEVEALQSDGRTAAVQTKAT
jgi:hypothetical protein